MHRSCNDGVIQLSPLSSYAVLEVVEISHACFVHLVLQYSLLEAIHIRKEGQQAMNRDEGSYQLSHAYDRFLDTASSRCVENRKN